MRIALEIEKRKAEGNFFTKDVTKTVMANALDMVEWLADEGAGMLRERMPVGTGFTRDNIEGMTYKRARIITGASVQSRFGKVRLRPGLTRTPASPSWPAARRPYVTMSVLESGKYRGHPRRANRMVRRVWARLRGYERSIRRDLTEGLN